ncbi:hypothetical protein [Brachybacterium sp. Marseille-Q7125]|uniref:hypothetical protein n=1 Tax=Brachybacterium sp. Marseille-Q7125 TaxID=2932815 RepID=UPI001FF2C1DE|nr:hypothetical protein [Brachybacterium sp. Marseille-Q7125]
MNSWQTDLLASMTDALPGADIDPYGSVTDPALIDGWSDLDVVITSRAAFDVDGVYQGSWTVFYEEGSRTWQEDPGVSSVPSSRPRQSSW